MSNILNTMLSSMMQPKPPGLDQQGGALSMAAQSTGQAQGNDFRDSTVLPSVAEQMRSAQAMIMPLLKRSIEQQSQYEEDADSAWGRLNNQLAPQEYDFGQFAADLAQGNRGNSMGELLANLGGSVSKGRRTFDATEREKAALLQDLAQKRADSNEKRVFDLFGRSRQLNGQGVPEFFLPNGTPVYKAGTRLIYADKDGNPKEWLGAEKTVVGGDTLYRSKTQLVETLTRQFIEKGEYRDLGEATKAAEAEADRIISGVSQNLGIQPRPSTPAAGTPSTHSANSSKAIPIDNELQIDRKMLEGLSPDSQASVLRVINRYQMNPNEGTQRAMEQELARVLGSTSTSGVLPKKNVQLAAEKEAYGSSTGKHMSDTLVDLQKTGMAAYDLVGELNVLEELYKTHGDKVPEGQLGPVIGMIKSGAKSLGIDIQGTGATDVINALGVKQALKSRTSEGTNLLPGAMSNYEDQLLQKTAPVLGLTQEGRLVLIQIMKAQLGMKSKLAEAARGYINKNGRLDEGWFNGAAEIAKSNPFLDPDRIQALEEYGKRLAKGAK